MNLTLAGGGVLGGTWGIAGRQGAGRSPGGWEQPASTDLQGGM